MDDRFPQQFNVLGLDNIGSAMEARDTVLPGGLLEESLREGFALNLLEMQTNAATLNLLNEPPAQVLQEGESLLQAGISALQGQRYGEALSFLEKALERYTALNLNAGQAQALSYLTLVAYSNGDYQNSIQYGQRTLVLAYPLNQHSMAIKILGTIGNAYRHLKDVGRSRHFQHESLGLAQKLGDHRGAMAALNNLGLVFKATQDYAQAISYEKQALVLARTLQDQSVEAQVLKNLGNAYYAIGETETAIDYYEQRLALVRALEQPRLEIQVLKHLSTACYSVGRPTAAIGYARDRVTLTQRLEDFAAEEQALWSLAIFHEGLEQTQQAVEAHQHRLKVARLLANSVLFIQVQADLKRLFCNLGDFDRANQVSQEHLILEVVSSIY
jgi:tetratricopeptide (TPR) repeat protein